MNLNTTIDLDIKGFFHWWGSELAFLVPSKLRQAVRDRTGTLLFIPDEQGFSVSFIRDDNQEVSLQQRLEFVDTDAYQQLMAQNPAFEKAEHVLCLNQTQALHKVIYLPTATQENLQQVVSFELDRYTPFKLDQVYFSVVVLGKTELGQLQVLLVLTPKALLDAQLDMLDSWQAHPHRVAYSQANLEFPQSEHAYNLLPNRYRQTVSKLEQSTHWLLSLAIVLLSLAALVWPVWQESQAVDVLKSSMKALEKQTQAVEAQQQEIDALHAETQKLIDLKQKAPALLPVLDELTKLLKDDTWLTHMQYSEQHMQIQGQSPAASALIGILEASDFFNNVSFVSPLTQDKTTGRERFQISMGVEMPAPKVEEPAPAEDATTEEQPVDAGDEQSSDTTEEPLADPAADTESDATSGEQP
jgi:general secretion pathway protein L